MTKREIMKAVDLVERFERDGADPLAGVNECVWCQEHYHIDAGLDPSALCNGCAQTLAVAFALHIAKVA